jgi:hypothetical protein
MLDQIKAKAAGWKDSLEKWGDDNYNEDRRDMEYLLSEIERLTEQRDKANKKAREQCLYCKYGAHD